MTKRRARLEFGAFQQQGQRVGREMVQVVRAVKSVERGWNANSPPKARDLIDKAACVERHDDDRPARIAQRVHAARKLSNVGDMLDDGKTYHRIELPKIGGKKVATMKFDSVAIFVLRQVDADETQIGARFAQILEKLSAPAPDVDDRSGCVRQLPLDPPEESIIWVSEPFSMGILIVFGSVLFHPRYALRIAECMAACRAFVDTRLGVRTPERCRPAADWTGERRSHEHQGSRLSARGGVFSWLGELRRTTGE